MHRQRDFLLLAAVAAAAATPAMGQALAPTVAPGDSTNFFYFQLKDLSTFLIGLAGFLVAFANLRSSYLRKARIRAEIAGHLFFARMEKGEDLRFLTTIHLFNQGAQATLATDLQLILWYGNVQMIR